MVICLRSIYFLLPTMLNFNAAVSLFLPLRTTPWRGSLFALSFLPMRTIMKKTTVLDISGYRVVPSITRQSWEKSESTLCIPGQGNYSRLLV